MSKQSFFYGKFKTVKSTLKLMVKQQVFVTKFLQYFCFQSSRTIVLLDAETKGRDAVKQPEGLDHKLIVLEKEVSVARDVQGDRPARLLLWMGRTALCSHLQWETIIRPQGKKPTSMTDITLKKDIILTKSLRFLANR
ncbi:hypothetical protein AMECASPLE_020702 [Ameca splendens]|uniref:Uncharacterized protein n=1 Tax=Ameca splendens TaxID=208324 RepID=A0ABV0XGD4_9TELE